MEKKEKTATEWAEIKNNIEQVKNEVEKAFACRYSIYNSAEKKAYHSGKTFRTNGYGDISLYIMRNKDPWNFLIIEYDDGEDGSGFYPPDYDSLDSLVADMIAEIEG